MNDISVDEIQKGRENFLAEFSRLENEVSKQFVGQKKILREALVVLTAGGHILLE